MENSAFLQSDEQSTRFRSNSGNDDELQGRSQIASWELEAEAKTTSLLSSNLMLESDKLLSSTASNPTATKKITRFLGLKRRNSVAEAIGGTFPAGQSTPVGISVGTISVNSCSTSNASPAQSLASSPQSAGTLVNHFALLNAQATASGARPLGEVNVSDTKLKKKLFRFSALASSKAKADENQAHYFTSATPEDVANGVGSAMLENVVLKQVMDCIGLSDFTESQEAPGKAAGYSELPNNIGKSSPLKSGVQGGTECSSDPVGLSSSGNLASSKGMGDSLSTKAMEYISLLTYPPVETGKRASLASIRESALVKQRRQAVVCLTCYLLAIRLSSFDLFIILLLISNCALLYAMKNARKFNTAMAKRALRQRLGWAKQFVGGVFNKRGHSQILPDTGVDASAVSATPEAPDSALLLAADVDKGHRIKLFGKASSAATGQKDITNCSGLTESNGASVPKVSQLSPPKASPLGSVDDLPSLEQKQPFKKILFFNRNRSNSGPAVHSAEASSFESRHSKHHHSQYAGGEADELDSKFYEKGQPAYALANDTTELDILDKEVGAVARSNSTGQISSYLSELKAPPKSSSSSKLLDEFPLMTVGHVSAAESADDAKDLASCSEPKSFI